MSLLGVPSSYINKLLHLASNLIALSLQKALNDTTSKPTFIIWLPPTSESGPSRAPSYCLPLWAKCDSPQLLLCFLLYDRGPLDHSKPFQEQKPSRQQEAIRCNLLGPGPHSAPKDNSICFCLYSLILLLKRELSPTLAQRISLDKEVNRRSENGKILPEFNSIK